MYKGIMFTLEKEPSKTYKDSFGEFEVVSLYGDFVERSERVDIWSGNIDRKIRKYLKTHYDELLARQEELDEDSTSFKFYVKVKNAIDSILLAELIQDVTISKLLIDIYVRYDGDDGYYPSAIYKPYTWDYRKL